MAKVNGAQSVEMIPGRKIVLSRGKGKTNVAELQWLTNTVLQSAAAWKQTGWAYIADCSAMDPKASELDPATSTDIPPLSASTQSPCSLLS